MDMVRWSLAGCTISPITSKKCTGTNVNMSEMYGAQSHLTAPVSVSPPGTC